MCHSSRPILLYTDLVPSSRCTPLFHCFPHSSRPLSSPAAALRPALDLQSTAMINQFLDDVDWGEIDFLIVDTPPGTSDEHITVCQKLQSMGGVDGCVLVTTPQVPPPCIPPHTAHLSLYTGYLSHLHLLTLAPPHIPSSLHPNLWCLPSMCESCHACVMLCCSCTNPLAESCTGRCASGDHVLSQGEAAYTRAC